MNKILLLTQVNGNAIAVFVDSIDILLASPLEGRTVVGLKGGEDNHIVVRESFEDILFSLFNGGIAETFRIRKMPVSRPSTGELLERLEIARQLGATEPETN